LKTSIADVDAAVQTPAQQKLSLQTARPAVPPPAARLPPVRNYAAAAQLHSGPEKRYVRERKSRNA
jgi:hypothetical protein